MPFVKGQSGNPAGKPLGAKSFTTKVREALLKIADGKDYTYEEAFIKSILKKGIVDGDSGTQRLIWNYLDGMPAQSIQHSGELMTGLTEEQKAKLELLLNNDKQRSFKKGDRRDTTGKDLPLQ